MSSRSDTISRPTPATHPCPACGKLLPDGASFCGGCGHRAVNPAVTIASRSRPAVPVPAPAAATGPLGELPAVVGNYRIEAVLGVGGMGWVYRAVDVSLGRTVAIKTLAPAVAADTEARLRFEREARTIAALDHPNITSIFSLDAAAKPPYFAMEYVEGESLGQRLEREGRLTPEEACRLMVQAAEGLQAAAASGLIHRDIKPSNLLLRKKDRRLKITDFGLAKPVGDKSVTSGQIIVGTPLYMSPEQAMGKPLDYRSDLYSLGATFYHALAGAPPFDDEATMAVLLAHLNTPLPPMVERAPGVPDSLRAVIEKLLEKEPTRRYESYDALLADLAAVQGELGSASRSGPAAFPAARGETAPIVCANPPTFWRRSWQILRRPSEFFRELSASETYQGALGHLSLVALLAAGMTNRLVHGAPFFRLIVVLCLLVLVLTPFAWILLKIRRRGFGAVDGFRVAAYSVTPFLVLGFVFWPLMLAWSLSLVARGAYLIPGKNST